MKLNDDIYSLAFAAFLDDKQLEYENHDDFLQPIEMNYDEVSNVFFGAITIIGVQLCLISLVMIYSLTSPSFHIDSASSFSIILARLFSSMMMHL